MFIIWINKFFFSGRLLKDLLQALLAGLRHRRLSSAPAVQAAHSSLRHSSQSQRGTTVSFLRVWHPAGAHILYNTWARTGGRQAGAGVRYQRWGRQRDHLHPAGSGQTWTSEAQSAGHHYIAARPHYLPEHLYHLHFHLTLPLLIVHAAFHMTLPPQDVSKWIIIVYLDLRLNHSRKSPVPNLGFCGIFWSQSRTSCSEDIWSSFHYPAPSLWLKNAESI